MYRGNGVVAACAFWVRAARVQLSVSSLGFENYFQNLSCRTK
jgi:hypothetical protein